MQILSPYPQTRGRRECRVRAAPAVSCAKSCAIGAHEHTGERRTLRHPLRNGFTAYFVLFPATNSFCHRRLQISGSAEPVGSNIASAALTPATGARTTRLRRTQQPPPLPDKPCAARRRFDESLEAPLVLHTVHRSRGSSRPATSGARNAAASTASHPNVQ